MVLEKTLESPLGSKEIKSVHPEGSQSWIFIGSTEYALNVLHIHWMLKLKLQYFGHLMGSTDSLENTLMLGKFEDRRRRGYQKMMVR